MKQYARSQAQNLAGRMVWFREVTGGTPKLGRVVGYYFEQAKVVMEVGFGPLATVSYTSNMVSLTANVREGYWYYTAIDVELIDPQQLGKNDRYPHECLVCGSAAFILFRTVECSSLTCRHFHP